MEPVKHQHSQKIETQVPVLQSQLCRFTTMMRIPMPVLSAGVRSQPLDFAVNVFYGHMDSCRVYVGCWWACSSLNAYQKPEELDMAANWPLFQAGVFANFGPVRQIRKGDTA